MKSDLNLLERLEKKIDKWLESKSKTKDADMVRLIALYCELRGNNNIENSDAPIRTPSEAVIAWAKQAGDKSEVK